MADLSRRAVLRWGTGLSATGLIAACDSGSASAPGPAPSRSPSPSPTVTPTGSPGPTGDLLLVAAAAALENLAGQVYAAGVQAASAGQLGTVPPAVVALITTTAAHHADHAAGWNALLSRAGVAPVTATPLAVAPALLARAQAARDVPTLLTVAREVEQLAAATYVQATATAARKATVVTAAAVAPVEAGHAAVLALFLDGAPGARGPLQAALWDDTTALTGASYLG